MTGERISQKYNALRGFPFSRKITLFELVVVFLLLCGIYYLLIDRLIYFRRQYEVAQVNWTIAAIHTARGVDAAARRVGRHRGEKPGAARNPMQYLEPAPPNYIGELCDPDPMNVERGIWYFDRCNSWLVYVYNSEKFFAPEYPKILKFNVESLRLLTDPARTF
ncbi:MAG TPA: hypothetical protein VGE60_09465 [Telluria sp.]